MCSELGGRPCCMSAQTGDVFPPCFTVWMIVLLVRAAARDWKVLLGEGGRYGSGEFHVLFRVVVGSCVKVARWKRKVSSNCILFSSNSLLVAYCISSINSDTLIIRRPKFGKTISLLLILTPYSNNLITSGPSIIIMFALAYKFSNACEQ